MYMFCSSEVNVCDSEVTVFDLLSCDCSWSILECTVVTVDDTEVAVYSFLLQGEESEWCICFNGTITAKWWALPGAAGTTREVWFNAMVDTPLSRTKMGNVRASKGGGDVCYLNEVTVVSSYEVSCSEGTDEYVPISSFLDYVLAGVSSNVAGHADAATLCGGVGSTCPACENVCALATEIGVGTAYIHPDCDGDSVKGCVAARNVKIWCASARNVSDRSATYCDWSVDSLESRVLSVVVCAMAHVDVEVPVVSGGYHFVDSSEYVLEEYPGMEPSDHKSVARIAVLFEEVSVYTVCHLLCYSEVTAIENKQIVMQPICVADVVRAHANALMVPIDGGQPGPGVEAGTLIQKSYVCGLTGSFESMIHKHAAMGDGQTWELRSSLYWTLFEK